MLKYALTMGAAESSGNPVVGFLVIVGVAFLVWACTRKKPGIRVTETVTIQRE